MREGRNQYYCNSGLKNVLRRVLARKTLEKPLAPGIRIGISGLSEVPYIVATTLETAQRVIKVVLPYMLYTLAYHSP